MSMKLSIDKIDAFIFDFDGVMTNNLVYLDQEGRESVRCSRADGLAIDVLHKLNKPAFILSTEKNLVVAMRAKKLGISVIQGVAEKSKSIKDLANKNNYNLNNIFYVGNDLNDYYAMKLCGFSACPADSHFKIKRISNFTLKVKGGNGVVKDLLEEVFRLNLLKILYSD